MKSKVEDPGLYTVKIPGIETYVEMWCCTADDLAINSKVAVADVDNDDDWTRNNLLPNVGMYTYSDSRSWMPPEAARDRFPATFALGYIRFDPWRLRCPTYRRDIITEVVDANYVRLRDYGSEEPVLVQYMDCNAAVFSVDDTVLVKFEDNDWNKPLVVGFVKEPKYCSAPFWTPGDQWDFDQQIHIGVGSSTYPQWPDPDVTRLGYLYQKWISTTECVVVGPKVAGSCYVSILNNETGETTTLTKCLRTILCNPPGPASWSTDYIFANGNPTNVWIVAWGSGACYRVLVEHWQKLKEGAEDAIDGEWTLRASRTDVAGGNLRDGDARVEGHRTNLFGPTYGNYIDNAGKVWVIYFEATGTIEEGVDIDCCAGYSGDCSHYATNQRVLRKWGVASVDVATWAQSGFPGFTDKIKWREDWYEVCERYVPKYWTESWSCDECYVSGFLYSGPCPSHPAGAGCCFQQDFYCENPYYKFYGGFINHDGTYFLQDALYELYDRGYDWDWGPCELTCPECKPGSCCEATSTGDCDCCWNFCEGLRCPDQSCVAVKGIQEWGFTPDGIDDLYYCQGMGCDNCVPYIDQNTGGCGCFGGQFWHSTIVADRSWVDGYGNPYYIMWVWDYDRHYIPYYEEGFGEQVAVYRRESMMIDNLGGRVNCGIPSLNPHPPASLSDPWQNIAESLEYFPYGYYYLSRAHCKHSWTDSIGTTEGWEGYLIGAPEDPEETHYLGKEITINHRDPLAVATYDNIDQIPWMVTQEEEDASGLYGLWVEAKPATSQTSSSISASSSSSSSSTSTSTSTSISSSSSSASQSSSSVSQTQSGSTSSVSAIASSTTSSSSSSS